VKTSWDYSDRASTYDKRADYSTEAVAKVIGAMGLVAHDWVADIGAGTGKLSKILLAQGLNVRAVEPNTNMRKIGVSNTVGGQISWVEGTGEATGLKDSSVRASFFGSSFNVVDQSTALREVSRISEPQGWFACMWNHRDLNDPIQRQIESVIYAKLPSYDYGSRRTDPSSVLSLSGLFGPVEKVESTFKVWMNREDVIQAWQSHETLARQAGESFADIIERIGEVLVGEEVCVPYSTRIWFARLNQ